MMQALPQKKAKRHVKFLSGWDLCAFLGRIYLIPGHKQSQKGAKMNELALVADVVPDAFPDVIPSITKDLGDQKAARTRLKPPVKRKPYVPPHVDDLGNIEATTFQTSVILR